MAITLTPAAFEEAATFIRDNGTALHAARFDFHFGRGSVDTVRDALARYQNVDGGFGHGLEHDLRTKNSSVICTTVGLQILTEVGAGADDPVARAAMHYLDSAFRGRGWPAINADCNDAPHAPWWTYDPARERCRGYQANPGAEIVGYLLQFGTSLPGSTVDDLLTHTLDRLGAGPLEMHELLCYLRLYDCPALGQPYRDALLPHLLEQAFSLVKVEPADWEEYGLTPLDVIATPDSPLADFFADSLEADFRHRLDRQGGDGAWRPAWSWGEMFPATWRLVEAEIKAELTLRFLCQLDRFGRLPYTERPRDTL